MVGYFSRSLADVSPSLPPPMATVDIASIARGGHDDVAGAMAMTMAEAIEIT